LRQDTLLKLKQYEKKEEDKKGKEEEKKRKKDKKGFCASCFFLLRGKDAVTASPKKNEL